VCGATGKVSWLHHASQVALSYDKASVCHKAIYPNISSGFGTKVLSACIFKIDRSQISIPKTGGRVSAYL